MNHSITKIRKNELHSSGGVRDGKLSGPGWEEIGTGVFIPEEDACQYAMESIIHGTERERQEFTEWFYSGNYVKTGDAQSENNPEAG